VYEPFTVDAVKQSDHLLIHRFGAGLCELEASRIQMAFGNVRADLRAALKKIGSFTVLHEAELIADPRKVRSDRP